VTVIGAGLTADRSLTGHAAGPGPSPIRLLLVDDHPVVRAGLESLMSDVDGIEVVGTAADADEAIDIASRTKPDLVLMDLSMPGIGGVGATKAILAEQPGIQVVVLTSFADRDAVVEALDAGAVGYLLKDASAGDLVRGIKSAAEGSHPIDPRVAGALLDRRSRPPSAAEQLTDRERDVLLLVAQGFANKQIARNLAIREATVKRHLTHAYQRIGVSDRTQAAIWAVQHLQAG
jgi:DNA-binding NarL/FixJ family response regulator